MALPLTFGSTRIESEWDAHPALLHPRLKAIVTAACVHAFTEHGWILHATCFLRTPAEDAELKGSGVHCTGRAGDFRTNGIDPKAVEELTDWVNAHWLYDPDRPALPVAYSKPHGTGPHLHLQVHSQTKPRDVAGNVATHPAAA